MNFNAYSSGSLPSSWSGSSSNVNIHSETLGLTNNKFIKIYTANQWLQTPTYDISSCINIKFGFRYKNVFGNVATESGDDLKIYISSDDGQNWTQIGNTILGSSIISSWTSSPTYYVNSGLTSTFKIKFQTTCNELNDAWYIDDFHIISTKTDFDWINNNDDIYSGYGGNVGIGTSSPSSKLDVVGNTSISGELNMNSNRINNVVDPVNDQEVSTKKYVDDQITVLASNTTFSAGNDINSTSFNNKIIQLEDDIDVSTIKASGGSGLSFSDDDNNLGVFIKDGGNVGINTLNAEYNFHVNGSTLVKDSLFIEGKVGIGTKTPRTWLHVKGPAYESGPYSADPDAHHHVMLVENTYDAGGNYNYNQHGLAIKLRPGKNPGSAPPDLYTTPMLSFW